MIEPGGGHRFQSDPREPLAGVHGGHPVWTRLELAKEELKSFSAMAYFWTLMPLLP
jgi:hypothetical protein